ncbi:hypothetical protein ACFVZW_29780 [Streptomyces sp. NPDC059567]|uniref:hypothetical protein n=1 Tax=Streptomyces sp. NPDC059567 TaxID=3346867 RepID=UPI0036962246
MRSNDVLEGLALNPALPVPLLRRLFHHREACKEAARRRTDLTVELCEEILAFGHDDQALALVCNRTLPAPVRHALATHPDMWVRSAAMRAEGLPVDLLRGFVTDPDPDVRKFAAAKEDLPPALLAHLAEDPDPGVRAELAQWWTSAPEDVRRKLLTDPEAAVRAAACSTYFKRLPHPVPPADLRPALLADPVTRAGVIAHVDLDAATARDLACDPDDGVRKAVAAHPQLPPDLREALGRDAHPAVRAEIFVRQDIDDVLRAEIHDGLVAGAARVKDFWEGYARGDEDALCRVTLFDLRFRVVEWVRADPLPHVDSPYPAFRRSAAHADDLPDEAVARLLDDEDQYVRLAMAVRTPDLDPVVAERLERRHKDSRKAPTRPADRVTFPPETLRRFATDPNPWIRLLALRDPDLPPELATRLADDAEGRVRRATAGHPKVPVAALLELLADDDGWVAKAAAGHPALPITTMEALIDGPGSTA